jgi:DNA topoisomerase-2
VVQGDSDAALIERAFAKSMADARKEWLRGYDANVYVDHSSAALTYSDFVDKELIHFSNADNVRSIPSMVDGLKPGQRKILYACFKRGKSMIKNEIKVAQLAGYVSEHSAYHHGEASLAGTIVGMAQTFVGSNNISLLHPAGQFGTRLLGGKDAASPRYIFTKLPALTRLIFHPDDDGLLQYLEDDGQVRPPACTRRTLRAAASAPLHAATHLTTSPRLTPSAPLPAPHASRPPRLRAARLSPSAPVASRLTPSAPLSCASVD